MELFKVYITHDPGMTMAYFTAGQHGPHMHYLNVGNCRLKGKTRKKTHGLRIYNFEKLIPRGWSAPTPGQYTCILLQYSEILFSETAFPIKAKFYMKHL